MPIKVTCQCGKSFAAKDELAGKAVKCPNCQQPLRIPGGSSSPAKAAAPKAAAAPAKAAAKPAAKPAPKPAAKPASASSSSGIGIGEEVRPFGLSDSALSEVGLTKQALNTRPCPGCTAPLTPDAVICIKCGFNTKLGRRMETIKVGNKGGPEGHHAVTAELMERAALAIEDQAAEDRKKTSEGVPFWVYLIGLAATVGFCLMMSLIPQGVGMAIAGLVLIVLSLVVNFYAWLRGLIEAFKQNVFLGLGILFGDIAISAGFIAMIYFEIPYVGLVTRYLAAPLLWTIYVIANWEECGMYMTMIWFGIFMRWIGLGMLLLGAIMATSQGQEQAARPALPPPYVGPANPGVTPEAPPAADSAAPEPAAPARDQSAARARIRSAGTAEFPGLRQAAAAGWQNRRGLHCWNLAA